MTSSTGVFLSPQLQDACFSHMCTFQLHGNYLRCNNIYFPNIVLFGYVRLWNLLSLANMTH